MHSSGNNIKFIPYSDAGNGDKNRDLSLDEYLNKIKPHLGNITIDFQNSDVWKIQLPVAVNFISPNDSKKKRVTHWSSDNTKFTPHSDANDVFEKLFQSLRL